MSLSVISDISEDTPVEEIRQRISELTAQKVELEKQNAELAARLRWFEEQVRLAKHRQFGPSSEKTPAEQQSLMLFDEAEATADSETPEPTLETVTYKRVKQKGYRAEQLKDLPVETVEHKLPDEKQVCPCCSGPLHVMGKEISRKLKIVPATVSVVEHIQFKYSCRHCEEHEIKTPVITAPMPPAAFPGSLASPSIVAHTMSQKFVSALPLYRQEQEFERNGLQLSRQTLANWMIAGATELTPLYKRMKTDLLARDHIQADETTLQVLNEPERAAQTKSYMWLYRSGRIGPPIVLFEYQQTRGADHPKLFLKDYRGYLQADGYEERSAFEKPCGTDSRRTDRTVLRERPVSATMARIECPCRYKSLISIHSSDVTMNGYTSEKRVADTRKTNEKQGGVGQF